MAPPDGPISGGEDAAQLIARLQAQGEVDAHGAFTLDREQARRKIQSFQLVNPARYVLELVQAAVLKGAQSLEFSLTSTELHLRCDGEPFTLTDFEHLYGALLLRASEQSGRARRHLALGLCTALAVDPALVRVESGSRAGAVFLELRKDAPDRLGPLPSEPQRAAFPTTHIWVRHRVGAQMLGRFLSHRKGRLPEEELLRHHCVYAPLRISLDDERISKPLKLPGVKQQYPFSHENIHGALGLLTSAPLRWSESAVASFDTMPTELRLIKNSVWVDTVRPELLLPGYQALADCSLLRQDISHEHVVQDEQYLWVVNVVLAHQIGRLASDCGEVLYGTQPLPDAAVQRLRGQLKTLLHRLGSVATLLRWADEPPPPGPRGTPAPHWPQKVSGAGHLLRFPLCRTTQGTWVNLQQLLEDVGQHGSLAFCPILSSEADPARPLVLHLSDAWEQTMLATLFDCPLQDRTSAMQHALRRAQNRAAWQRRPMPPTLAGEGYLAKVPISGPGLRGELGVGCPGPGGTPRRLARLLLVSQGNLLVAKSVLTPIPDLTIVIEANFAPSDLFSDVVGDAVLADALGAAFAALLPLVQALLKVNVEPPLQAVRARLLRGLLFVLLSASAQQQMRVLAGVDKELALGKAALAVDAAKLWGALRDCPLFEQLGAALVSLAQVEAFAREYGCAPVLVLPPLPPTEHAAYQRAQYAQQLLSPGLAAATWQTTHEWAPSKARRPQPPELILCLANEDQELAQPLRAYLGERYADMQEWLRALKTKPPAPSTPPEGNALPVRPAEILRLVPPRRMQNECWAWVPLGDGASFLGLLSLPSPKRELHRLVVEFYHGATLVGTRQIPMPTGDLLLASMELSRLVPCSEHELAIRLMRRISATLPALVSAVLHGNTLPPDERLWLLRLTAALFPTGVFRRAYDKLLQQAAPTPAGQKLAEEQYGRLLRLAVQKPVRRIEEALRLELAADANLALAIERLSKIADPPSSQETAAELDAEAEEATTAAALSWVELLYPDSAPQPAWQRVRRPLPLLLQAPMLNSTGGALLSLQAVLAELDKHREVRYALPDTKDQLPLHPTRKVVEIPDTSSWDALCCLLGEQSLVPFAVPPATAAKAPPGRGEALVARQRTESRPPSLPALFTAAPVLFQRLPDTPPTPLPALAKLVLRERSSAEALAEISADISAELAADVSAELAADVSAEISAELTGEPDLAEPSSAAISLAQDQAEQLCQSVHAELLLIAPESVRLHAYLDRISIELAPHNPPFAVRCTAEYLAVNLQHPLLRHAAQAKDDPMLRLFVASAIYTAAGRFLGVADGEAMAFHRLLGEHACRIVRGDPVPPDADAPWPVWGGP